MVTLFLVLVVVAASVFVYFAMKNGKIEDKNGNNIPDVVENAVEEFAVKVEVVKEKVKKATKKPAAKAAKKSAKKTK